MKPIESVRTIEVRGRHEAKQRYEVRGHIEVGQKALLMYQLLRHQ